MKGIFIVPTGVGAEIGGHAGDANPAAKLIAGVCDELIVHPNVVNASDINEMTSNMLYVEGSMLDRFLDGEIALKRVSGNKILVVVNKPVENYVVNAITASRITIGADIKIVELETPLRMIGRIEDNKATGDVLGWKELVEQIEDYDFDALAINTIIDVDRDIKLNYFRYGGINPWGGVEAICSKLISRALNKPAAHAPSEDTDPEDKEVYFISYDKLVDPRITPEVISMAYLHCVIKGLHKAPRLVDRTHRIDYYDGDMLRAEEIDFMISPAYCVGPPHIMCLERGIPIIVVLENTTKADRHMSSNEYIFVQNYLEAAGYIVAMKIGIDVRTVRRPLEHTEILNREKEK